MNKIILTLLFVSFIFNKINAQQDTIIPYFNKIFFKEMSVYKADSVKVYKQLEKTSKKEFFSKTLLEIYSNNKLTEKESFYIVIFTFSELKKIIPNYKKLKHSIFTDSTAYLKKITERFLMQKEEFEQNLLVEEEQERQRQIEELKKKYEVDVEKKDKIKEDENISVTDSITNTSKNNIIIDKNSKEKLEKELDIEEKKLKEEEQKILKEKKRLEIEMKEIKIKEIERKENEDN